MLYEIGQANRLGTRASNQDRFAAVETDDAVLLVLADGMGGHRGGEMAAQILVDVASDALLNEPLPVRDVERFLTGIITRTHGAIHDYARESGLDAPPGTTGVLCLVQDGVAQWAHVGDSRLYLFRDQLPLYRTRDHSYVERLYRRGEIRRSDTSFHPMRNQITQCIGRLPELPDVEVGRPTPLSPGDVLLLCSDGLWGALEDMQIGALMNAPDIDAAVNQLAEQAETNSYPHSDNISVLALRFVSRNHGNAALSRPADTRKSVATRRPRQERLEDAIEQIEEVLRKYENEMNR
ncbi:MAG: PP2C family serine/threonine-protein phosphatase [Thiohalomonadaceae bacterium]